MGRPAALTAALLFLLANQVVPAASSHRDLLYMTFPPDTPVEYSGDAQASADGKSSGDELSPYELMFVLNAWKCKESNEGTYTPYTIDNCLDKTKMRGYDAFLYRSADSTCKIFPKCTPTKGNKGELLFMYEYGGN